MKQKSIKISSKTLFTFKKRAKNHGIQTTDPTTDTITTLTTTTGFRVNN